MSFQLSLTEYSAKYKVSISTLRRRIKKGELPYTQEAGKYMLPDYPFDELLSDSQTVPPQERMASRRHNVVPPQKTTQESAAIPFLKPLGMNLSFDDEEDYYEEEDEEDVIAAEATQTQEQEIPSAPNLDATHLDVLAELKKAYTLILSEKEEQILQLKQHIVDLQTLNKALDNEVNRLQKKQVSNPRLKTSFVKHDF